MGAFNFDFYSLMYRLPAIVLALTVHEYAHGRAAYAFGDPTAKNAGRLTLNPLRHLDVLGTLALIFFGFGWAKPVPVNPYYFQGDRGKKVMWVSVAGPLSNIIQAMVATVLLSLWVRFAGGSAFVYWFSSFVYYFILINIVLAVFNLLPIPPLDGSKILAGLLPDRHQNIILTLDRYGFVILIAMMYLGLTGRIISPVVNIVLKGMFSLAGL
ncbi:MAG: site-2 protease family protein [Clostridiales bacterium]|nr:site-2 protease family protein [Clostridiales bacterium]